MMFTERFSMPSSDSPFKIILLGNTASGKSYYLGSLYAMRQSIETPHKFSIKGEDDKTETRMEAIHKILTNKEEGAVPSTLKMDTTKVLFQKRLTTYFNVHITDIYGQSTVVGRDIKETQSLLEKIPEQDGIIITIKAPDSFDEYGDAVDQLNRLLDLASHLIKAKPKIPIALIITQIDKVKGLSQISYEIDNELDEIRTEYQEDPDIFKQKIKFLLRDIINPKVGVAVENEYIGGLVQRFYDKFEGTKIARRAFPSTSLGFNNAKLNPKDKSTEIALGKQIYPYGTIASFLWVIYAYNRLYPSRYSRSGVKSMEVLEELRDIYLSGQAYESISKKWSINNLHELFL